MKMEDKHYPTDKSLSTQDYSLPAEQQSLVDERTREIKDLVRRTAQNLIDIGDKLREIKKILGHGNFVKWLEREFNWSVATASKMMQVSRQFKNVNFTNLNIGTSAIYLLAAPSTPESARTEALSRAAQGESVTYSMAKQLVLAHRTLIEADAQKNGSISGDNHEKLDSFGLPGSPDSPTIPQAIFTANAIEKINTLAEVEFFHEQLAREWLRMAREQKHLSILFCVMVANNDQIPNPNAKIWQEWVIQVITETLKRPSDLFTYTHTGMFLLLLPYTPIEGAISLAKTIKETIMTSTIEAYEGSDYLQEEFTLRLFVHSLIPSRDLPSLYVVLDDILLNHEIFD